MNQSPYAGSLASWHSLWSLCSRHSACRTAKSARHPDFAHPPNFMFAEARSLTWRIQAKNNQTT